MVPIAQVVRAPDCGSGGRGFKSHWVPYIKGFRKQLRKPFLVLRKEYKMFFSLEVKSKR
jgi:hypothetical protein